MSEAHELVVIGAGPAGMAAAATAARLGVSTLLIDEQSAPGGQIYRSVERGGHGASEVSASDWARGAALAAELRSSGATYRPGTQVWQLDTDRTVYVTDGSAVYGVTVAATGFVRLWRTNSATSPTWTLQ